MVLSKDRIAEGPTTENGDECWLYQLWLSPVVVGERTVKCPTVPYLTWAFTVMEIAPAHSRL